MRLGCNEQCTVPLNSPVALAWAPSTRISHLPCRARIFLGSDFGFSWPAGPLQRHLRKTQWQINRCMQNMQSSSVCVLQIKRPLASSAENVSVPAIEASRHRGGDRDASAPGNRVLRATATLRLLASYVLTSEGLLSPVGIACILISSDPLLRVLRIVSSFVSRGFPYAWALRGSTCAPHFAARRQ